MNPDYTTTFAFDNDFPALLDDGKEFGEKEECAQDEISVKLASNLLQARPVKGNCRVICFHPKLNVTLPQMTLVEIERVVDSWIEEMTALATRYNWVQVFENKGAVMGCSNPHPHCQVWSSDFLPNEPRVEHRTQREYYDNNHKSNLLMDYVTLELANEVKDAGNSRIVVQNDHWLVVVPFWAVWPYETLLLPKHLVARLTDLTADQKRDLSKIMKALTIRYDNLFETSFPYSMGWHGAPTGRFMSEESGHWLLHAHYYPPLLRSATVKKFMVGYELLGQAQRDLTAEQAARTLRSLSETHYKLKGN
jgi:UDPglucose--hexose-1-phosphate uridylyltransferase